MSNEIKPPIDIGGDKKKSGPGSINPDIEMRYSPQNGKSGGGGWMPAITAIVVSVIIAAVMVFVVNPNKTGVDTVASQIAEVNNKIVVLEGQQTSGDGKIDSLSSRLDTFLSNSVDYITQDDLAGLTDGMATDSQVSDMQSSIDSLRNENTFLSDRINVLEAVAPDEDNGDSTTPSDTIFGEVRWNIKDVQLVDATWTDTELWGFDRTNDYSIDIDSDDVIEEEDLYYLDVRIEVDDTGDYPYSLNTKDAYIEFVLYPRDDATLDQDLTYVDSDDPPWLEWDADFVTKTREGIEVTRRVVFSSDELGDHGTTYQVIDADEELEIDLVLELYYAEE